MHPPTWAGFPRDYRSDFERYVKHKDQIVKVDPYRIPRWAIPKVRVDAKLPVEYTGCWHGSKCPLVYNGECLRMHPEATEDMAYNTIREKRNELLRSEVNSLNYSNQWHGNPTSNKSAPPSLTTFHQYIYFTGTTRERLPNDLPVNVKLGIVQVKLHFPSKNTSM